ncbi:hypothetical protein [Phocaeicola sp.]
METSVYLKKARKIIQNPSIYILVASVIVLFSFIAAYFYKFHNCFSDNPNDWGNFGSYMGGVCGLFVSIVAIWVSYKLNIYTRSSSKIDELMYDIIKRNENIQALLKRLKELEDSIKQHCSNSLLNAARSAETGGKDEKLENLEYNSSAIKSNIIAELTIIKRNANLCFNRFLFKYSDAEELINSLNTASELESMKEAYDYIDKMIEYYSKQKI